MRQYTFEQLIYYGCAAYSSLFPNRAAMLNHMFLVAGNGFKWHEGMLIPTDWHGSNKLIRTHIKEAFENRKERHQFEKVEQAKQRERLAGVFEHFPGLEEKMYAEDPYDFAIPEDIQERVKDISAWQDDPRDGPPYYNWYPTDSKCSYARLLNWPKDIKPDYLRGIVETAELVIKTNDPTKPYCQASTSDAAREALKKVYGKFRRDKRLL